jgi:hypothetical protein
MVCTDKKNLIHRSDEHCAFRITMPKSNGWLNAVKELNTDYGFILVSLRYKQTQRSLQPKIYNAARQLWRGVVTRSYAAPLTTRSYNPRISGSIVQK